MTRYFVVDKSGRDATNRRHQIMRRFDSALSVAAYMLGRRVSEYFVVKSDAHGDRVVTFPSADVNEIQLALEQA